ncbi:hypothetical protein FBU30_009829 [Linnemannia zychae]|nr:hypothetical protein FBU30_009829 [Linnemannia zychae]
MSFNLGNNDRMPAFGDYTTNSKNPLQQAIRSSENNQGANMVLTPDNPSWHADPSRNNNNNSNQNSQDNTGAPYSGDRANTGNTGPFRAGPDNDSYLPSNAVPKGARFDPIMPDDVSQSLPNRQQRQQQGRPGQNPPGFASGEPDFDELLPPQ